MVWRQELSRWVERHVPANSEESTHLQRMHALSSMPGDPGSRRHFVPVHEHFDLRIAVQARTWELRPASDALDARWFALDEVPGCATDESVQRAHRKLLAAVG